MIHLKFHKLESLQSNCFEYGKLLSIQNLSCRRNRKKLLYFEHKTDFILPNEIRYFLSKEIYAKENIEEEEKNSQKNMRSD